MRLLLRAWPVAALMVVGASLPACSSSTPVVRLGAVYPVGGGYGPDGVDEWRGAQLAVDRINAAGGVHGRHVTLTLKDAESPDAVPGVFDQLHAAGVDLVLGTHQSLLSTTAAVSAARRGQLLWETGAVGETNAAMQPGRSFFRLAPMGANLGRAAVSFVGDELDARLPPHHPLRYAVAYVNDAYGRAVGQGALDQVSTAGQILAGSFSYQPATTDFSPLVARLAAAKPDVLVVAAYLEDGVAMRRATVAANVPLLASIGTSSSYCMPAFGAQLGRDAVGLFASDKPDGQVIRPDALLAPARQELAWARARYQSRWHAEMSAAALGGFANTWALVDHVLPRAAALTAQGVASAALTTKLAPGSLANGSGLDLAPPGAPDAGANRGAASVIWEWVAPGQRAVVWPPAFATTGISVVPISSTVSA